MNHSFLASKTSRYKEKDQVRGYFGGFYLHTQFLLQRNEAGRMSGSNTWTTVFNRLVCDGELSKVMTNHLRLKRDKIIQIISYQKSLHIHS